MKGFYSVLIGVIALFVLATAIFTVNSFNKSQALIPQKESFGYTIKQWQNVRMMLDKATADAIIDSAYPADCLTDPAKFSPDTNIYAYGQNVLTVTNSLCIIRNLTVVKSTATKTTGATWERNVYDVNASLQLECRHHYEIGLDLNSLAGYYKNVLFEKTIDITKITGAGAGCDLNVIDKQSNVIDVNLFV